MLPNHPCCTQVNERLSWNNPDSCQADCALPFLSCPPFNSSLLPCSGRGVCYNSLGSCACSTGYAGADCSSCALGYKRVGSYCVIGVALLPARSCAGAGCAGNLTTSEPLQGGGARHTLASGVAAVLSVAIGCMALAAVAAGIVARLRRRRLLAEYRDSVSRQAEACQA